MVKLLSRFTVKLQEQEQAAAARQRLEQAAQSSSEIELEPLSESAKVGVMKAQLHSIDDAGVIIGPAQAAGETRALVRNEPLRIGLRAGNTLLCAETQVLGRAKFEQDGATVFGYRLALPGKLAPVQMQKNSIAEQPKARAFNIEAELHCLKRQVPVRGMIAGFSEKMVQLRSRNAPDWLAEGERMTLKAALPSPIGDIEQVVLVTGVEQTKEPGVTMIGLQFVAPMHTLQEWLDAGPIRWGES